MRDMQPMSVGNELSQEKVDVNSGLVTDATSLKNGIWPQSVALWMVAFYMALFIIRPWEQLFPSWQAFYPERLYSICMIIVVFLSPKKQFRLTWQTVTILIFFASIAITGVFAYIPALTWDTLYVYFSVVVFYFIILLVIRTQYELVFIVLSYIVIMCVYLGKSQWEFFVNGQHRYDMGVVRMVGIENTFGGPNDLAMSVVASLPFALLLWKYKTEITTTWPLVWQTRCRRGLMLYGFLAVSTIVLTNSRSGLVGFLLYVAILMFSGKGVGRKIKYIVIGILVLSLLWLIVPEENKGRIRTIWDPEDGPANAQESAEGRVLGFKAGVEMFNRYPMTGVGAGNFVVYRVQNLDGIPLQAHNLEGQVLGEMGLLGAGVFLMMVGATFSNCWHINRLSKNQNNAVALLFRDFARACSVSLLLLIFLGTFGHNLYRFNWLWIAAFGVLARQMQQEYIALEADSTKGHLVHTGSGDNVHIGTYP